MTTDTDPPTRFAQAIAEASVCELPTLWDAEADAGLKAHLRRAGVLLFGENHGVAENPSVIYTLMKRFGFRGLALEWDEELMPVIEAFLETGDVEFEVVRRSFDGRITAGHFKLFRKLKDEDRLDHVVLFDGVLRLRTPLPKSRLPRGQNERDQQMASRLLAKLDPDVPTLAVAGSLHTLTSPLQVPEGRIVPMGAHVAVAIPGVPSGRIAYMSGHAYAWGAEGPTVRTFPTREHGWVAGQNRFHYDHGQWIYELSKATPATVPGAGFRPELPERDRSLG